MASKPARPAPSVDDYLSALDHPHKAAVEKLRRAILALDPKIREEVKWNAPSFALGEHFATFRPHPAPMLQLILHTGAKTKGKPRKFEIADPDRLLAWAAPDRCVVSFTSAADVAKKTAALRRILRAWIGQLGA